MSSWPPFSALTLTETAYKYLLRQAFFRKIKDNFDNLNGRVGSIEGSLLVFDHFNSSWITVSAQPAGRFFVNNGAAGDPNYSPLLAQDARGIWVNERIWTGTGSVDPGPPYDAGFSEMTIESSPNASGRSQGNAIWSAMELLFNSATRPVFFESRLKWGGSAVPRSLVGMIGALPNNWHNDANLPTDGVWLEFPDSTNVRFVTRAGGTSTNGSNITRPTTGTRFKARFEFTDTPSNRALCYLDDVLKETFTTNLPTSARLRAMLVSRVQSQNANNLLTVDRCRFSGDGLADA